MRVLPWVFMGSVLAAASGCAHAPILRGSADLETSSGTFLLQHEPSDVAGERMVRQAIQSAAPKLERWGKLRSRVEVRVFATHADLERAVGRPGWSWMRAWARWGDLSVQSPATWFDGGAAQAQADELILHELTHCLMYQLAAEEGDWQRKGIPAWFREGMASVTADQAHRRDTLVELERRLKREGADPLAGLEEIWREESRAVYSAAHHAFVYLLRRIGDEGIRQVLGEMRGGLCFDDAFERVVGKRREEFECEFRAYVLSEAWRVAR